VTTYSIQTRIYSIRWLCLGTFTFVVGGMVYWAIAAGPDKTIISAPALASTTRLADKGLEEGRIKAEGLSQAFRFAAKNVLPTVVVIKTPQSDGCPRCGSRECDNIDDKAETTPKSPVDEMAAFTVIGSGFLVDPSGIVMTNKHVIEGARNMVVQMADGRKYPVKQVKTDNEIDLAMLLIETKESLPAVQLGNSETTEIGDWVLAIGCPLDLEQTVSAGIISAKNRSFCPNHQAKLLQTDAAINPGSSGGPLVNLYGEVIGITTSIASDDGGYQGIGFAIPANLTNRLLQQATK
jgi:serine protease Do